MRAAVRASKAVGVFLVLMLVATGSALGAAQDLPVVTQDPHDYVAYCGLALVAIDFLGFDAVNYFAVSFFGLDPGFLASFVDVCT